MPPASVTNEPDDQQQQQRANGGVDSRQDDARTEVEAELRNEPTANEGACDSHEEVAENPEPGALHDLASQPSGNEADQQYDEQTLTRHVHLRCLQPHQQTDEFSSGSGDASPIFKDGRAESDHSPFEQGGITLLPY